MAEESHNEIVDTTKDCLPEFLKLTNEMRRQTKELAQFSMRFGTFNECWLGLESGAEMAWYLGITSSIIESRRRRVLVWTSCEVAEKYALPFVAESERDKAIAGLKAAREWAQGKMTANELTRVRRELQPDSAYGSHSPSTFDRSVTMSWFARQSVANAIRIDPPVPPCAYGYVVISAGYAQSHSAKDAGHLMSAVIHQSAAIYKKRYPTPPNSLEETPANDQEGR